MNGVKKNLFNSLGKKTCKKSSDKNRHFAVTTVKASNCQFTIIAVNLKDRYSIKKKLIERLKTQTKNNKNVQLAYPAM